MKFEFQDVSIDVTPTHDARKWYMTLEEAAMAYGVASSSVRSTLHRHPDELRDGVEKGVAFCNTPCRILSVAPTKLQRYQWLS